MNVRSQKILYAHKKVSLMPLRKFFTHNAEVSLNENLRYPRFCKENVSAPNEIYRYHQKKFDFLYYINKITTKIKNSFYLFHERFTMNHYKINF